MKYLAIIIGGTGPNTWEREHEIDHADNFMDAAQQAQNQADEMSGHVYSLEQSN